MTLRRFTEWELQKASADLMRTCLRPGAFAFHVPNERSSSFQRQILSAGGTLAGVADWIILAPHPLYDYCRGPLLGAGREGHSWVREKVDTIGRAYALELKAGRRRLSPSQASFSELCAAAYVPHRVARSLDEVIDALRDWGLLREGVA